MKLISTNSLIISALLLLSSHVLIAQNAILKGKITELNSEEPLIGATIKSGAQGVATDLDGNYELALPSGTHTISINFIGYESRSETITLQAGETLQKDFSLAEESTILQTATITSGKFEKPLGEVTVSLEVLKPRLIEAVNATSVDGALNKIPGLNIIGGQANIRGGSGWSYGAGSRVLLLVDDIPALQADAGRPNWSDYPCRKY